MSLVGPRPPLPYEFERYQAWHKRRVFELKPGLTGLWQIEGRSRTTFDEMVRMDLKYALKQSLWTDLKIILQTPGAMFSGKGAC
jgi:lipopolysaccharide/colanic/teichoic acid biosynthesis glycosyltransferase